MQLARQQEDDEEDQEDDQKLEDTDAVIADNPLADEYVDDIVVDDNNPKIQFKMKKTLLIAILGELFIIILILICINILYFSTYHTNYITRDHLKISIWISKDSSDEIIEQSLLYVVNNKLQFSLNYSFSVMEYIPPLSSHLSQIESDVDEGKYWGAFYVPENSSQDLMRDLIHQSNSSSPIALSLPCGYLYDQIRSGPSFQFSLGTTGSTLTTYLNGVLKSQLLPSLYSTPSSLTFINGALASKPVSTLTKTLHPVDRYGMFSVVGDGTMQLYLNGLYHGLGIIGIHTVLRGRGIDKGVLIGLMGWHRALGSGFIAIWPVVVPLILNPHNSDISQNIPRIFQWWALVWLELAVFSGMNYHIAKIFGGPMGLLVGVSTLMLMVASGTSSLPFDAMSEFYRIGYGFPFWSSIQGMRSLLFNSQPQLFGLCVGILFIWWGLMFLNLTLTRYYLNPRYGLHLFEEPDEKIVAERERVRARTLSLSLPPPGGLEEGPPLPLSGRDSVSMLEQSASGIQLQTVGRCDSDGIGEEHGEGHDDAPMLSRNRVSSTDHGASPAPPAPHLLTIDTEEETDESRDVTAAELANADAITIPLSDPSLRPILKEFTQKAVVFELALSLMMIVLLFLSYGNAWNPFAYHHRIKLAMLNLDTTPSNFTQLFAASFTGVYQQVATSPQFGFTVDHLDHTHLSLHEAIQKVEDNSWGTDGTYFGILILQNGSAADLTSRLASSTPLSPAFPYVSFVYNGANGGSYLNANIRIWSSVVYGALSYAISRAILTQDLDTIRSYQLTTLSSLTSFSYHNLHPYPPEAPALDSTINLSVLVLYLGMITNVAIITASHAPLRELGVRYETRMLLMFVHIALSSLILSFWPVLSLQWYGYEGLTGHTFFQYWSVLWLGMCSFGSISSMVSYIFGPLFGGIISIIIFSLNSAASGATLNSLLQPTFFWVGLGLPYHNIISSARYVLFGSNLLAFKRGIGILIVWVVLAFIAAMTLNERRKRYLRAKHKMAKVGRKLSTRIKSYRLEHFSPTHHHATETDKNTYSSPPAAVAATCVTLALEEDPAGDAPHGGKDERV
jgi:hypothetical protein